jgi:hypothetical protein
LHAVTSMPMPVEPRKSSPRRSIARSTPPSNSKGLAQERHRGEVELACQLHHREHRHLADSQRQTVPLIPWLINLRSQVTRLPIVDPIEGKQPPHTF